MGGSRSSKKERSKLRQKLLEIGSLVESSKVDKALSGNNSVDENSIKERIEKKNHQLSGKKRKEKNVTFREEKEREEYEKPVEEKAGKKKRKLSRKKRVKQKVNGADDDVIDQLGSVGEDDSKELKYGSLATESSQSELSRTKNSATLEEADVAIDKRTNKSRRTGKKKKDQISSEEVRTPIKEESGSVASEVYHISSVDVDSSKGMKKWINEYYHGRPGLKILQQRIDEFITSHEEREEEARKEREALAAEGGWTVVMHQKGRKKTTEAESGTTVGAVAAVVDKRRTKKPTDVGHDFYRFQKREAQRNEIMMLQSKFEEDKKRIQQLRAARKFRPY